MKAVLKQVHLLQLLAGAVCFSTSALFAQAPAWWTNRNVINESAVPRDFAPVNQGQVKWLATQAAAEFDEQLQPFGGAGPDITALVASFTTNNNYLPVNAGQLKHTVQPFYDRLFALGLTNCYPPGAGVPYPWTGSSLAARDFSVVNIGQVKYAFSFDLAPLTVDSDNNGLPDWWELKYFGHLGVDPNDDPDGDGLTNLQEYQRGTHPQHADADAHWDPNGDGLTIGERQQLGLSPTQHVGVVTLGQSDLSFEVRAVESHRSKSVGFSEFAAPDVVTKLKKYYLQETRTERFDGVSEQLNAQVTWRFDLVQQVSLPDGMFSGAWAQYEYVGFFSAVSNAWIYGTLAGAAIWVSNGICSGHNTRCGNDGSDYSETWTNIDHGSHWRPCTSNGCGDAYYDPWCNLDGVSSTLNATNMTDTLFSRQDPSAGEGTDTRTLTQEFTTPTLMLISANDLTKDDPWNHLAWDWVWQYDAYGVQTEGEDELGAVSYRHLSTDEVSLDLRQVCYRAIATNQSSLQNGTVYRVNIAHLFTAESDGTCRLLGTHSLVARYDGGNQLVFNPAGTLLEVPATNGEVRVTVFMLDLAVDGNRDGVIDFDDQADRTLRFWLNNDEDYPSAPDSIYPQDNMDPEAIPPHYLDCNDERIQTVRDLEDFTRLHLRVEVLLDQLQSGQLQLGLKWKDESLGLPAIHLFKACEADGGWAYIRNPLIAAQQRLEPYSVAIQDTRGLRTVEPHSGVADFIFRREFWSDTTNGSQVNFLFEGVSEGKGTVVPVILDSDGAVLAEGGGVRLELRDVERLYARAHSTPTEASFPYPYNQWLNHVETPFYITTNRGVAIFPADLNWQNGFDEGKELAFEPAEDETNQCVIFVHGVALTVPEVRCYTATFYKRLWWEGFRGRLVAFRWSTPIPSGAHAAWSFDDGEFHSWSSGRGFMNYVNHLKQQLPSSTISVAAHSLGNACVGSALRQGLVVDNYVMMEAAVALSTYYSTSIPPDSYSPRLTKVAAKTSPDTVSDQGYRSLLSMIHANIRGNWVNYHNAMDYWLETGHFASDGALIGLECNWGYDQQHKPDGLNLHYTYNTNSVEGARSWNRNGPLRPVELLDEALAYVAQAQTRAVGAESATNNPTPPDASSHIDLYDYGFRDLRTDHSGQFQRSIQQMYSNDSGAPYELPLYMQLMIDLKVTPPMWPQ